MGSKINDEEIENIIESDYIIYATGTSSHEAADREDLSLPTDDNNLIARLAERAGNKMIVSVVSPGAIIMPWAADVMGILLQFFPGQEAGNALADVLFGHISPSGKLPLTMPHIENEVEFSQEAYPGIPADNPQNVTYEEELLVGYRWYHHNNVHPKFAFGFGLSYATFVINELKVNHEYNCNDATDACEVEFKIARIDELGDKYTTASEIVQLYMDFPAISGEPPRILKGFQKVSLEAGKEEIVTMRLSLRDFSTFDESIDDWKVVEGTFKIYVGTSSNDLPLSIEIERSSLSVDIEVL